MIGAKGIDVNQPKGAFNNYVDKKGGRGVIKKSTLVHSGGVDLRMSTWTKLKKKDTNESREMTMKNLITSPFVQLLLEDAVHKR